MTRALRCIALAAALTLGSSPSWAENNPPTKEELEAAKQAFAQGRALYDQGKFAEALPKLQESYRLSRSPLLLYSIGKTQDQLGQKADAVATYKKFLADAPATSQQRPEVTQRVEALEQELAAAAKPPEKPAAVELAHQPADSVPPGKPHDVVVPAPADASLVVTLFFRNDKDEKFESKPMKPHKGQLIARIPGGKATGRSLQYYIEVRDSANALVTRSGKSTVPHLVLVEPDARPQFDAELDEPTGEIVVENNDTEAPLDLRGDKPPPPPPPEHPKWIAPAKWAATGTGAAMIGVSIAAYMIAARQADHITEDARSCGFPPCRKFDTEYAQQYESVGERYTTVHQVTLVAGVVAVGAAGYLWYRDSKRPSEERRTAIRARRRAPIALAPAVGATHVGAVLGGRF